MHSTLLCELAYEGDENQRQDSHWSLARHAFGNSAKHPIRRLSITDLDVMEDSPEEKHHNSLQKANKNFNQGHLQFGSSPDG
jgi:hypothetical protein